MAGLVATGCGHAAPAAHVKAAPEVAVTVPTTTAPKVYPLTGLPVDNPGHAARPALSVKIDNVAGSFPQVGLGQADIVTEALVEGGLTRLLATYQSQDAAQVGPIRSARPVDAALLRELGGGIFAYSGAATGEIAPSKSYSEAILLSFDAGVPAFHRVSWRQSPHNIFSSTPALWTTGMKAGAAATPPPPLFTYSPAPEGGPAGPASQAYMDMSRLSSAAWTWSPAQNAWLRSQNGAPDSNSDGSRIAAQNVVIMSVAIGPSGIYDADGNQDPWVLLTGSGSAWVLRNGQVVQGTWTRSSNTVPMSLSGAAGTITLQPGHTWIELVPHPYLPRLTP